MKDQEKENKFSVQKDNKIYNINIHTKNKTIEIFSDDYIFNFKEGELLIRIDNNFKEQNLDFNLLIKLFESKQIIIEKVIENECIILRIEISKIIPTNKTKYLILINNKLNKDKKINELYNQLLPLKSELKFIKEHKNYLPKNFNISLIKSIKGSFGSIIFKSISKNIYIIYTDGQKGIISYNLNTNQIITKIKNPHSDYIVKFSHYSDIKNNRDIIMSMFSLNFLKLWNFKNWKCILHLTNINEFGLLSSGSFFINNNEPFILTSNSHSTSFLKDSIKIFNLKGEKIKTIKNCQEPITHVIFHNENEKSFILAGTINNIKSYDYNNDILYKKYNESQKLISFILYKDNAILKIIGGCISKERKCCVKIWNFHYGNVMGRIMLDERVYGLCVNSEKFLFAGSFSGKIYIIDLDNQILDKAIEGHKNFISSIDNFHINEYGNCLISQGYDYEVKIWKFL